MSFSTGIIKLLLALCNLAFCVANFVLSIVFAYSITSNSYQSGTVLIMQLTLVGLTLVFGFGLWITCKRKFLLLKCYSLVLLAFVVVQIIALVMLVAGAGNSDEIARPIMNQACTMESTTRAVAKRGDQDEFWFCCCPDSCDETTWEAQIWELGWGHNETAIGESEKIALAQYKWPLLNCMARFAKPREDIKLLHASKELDNTEDTSCSPPNQRICQQNPAVMNAEGIDGPLGEAMCDGKDDCAAGVTGPDQVNWCGTPEDELDTSMTCGGKNHNTKGKPQASCTVSSVVTEKCSALNATECSGDSHCGYSENRGSSCVPKTTLEQTCTAAEPSACESTGDCTSGAVTSSGSTCKTRLQCVRTWLASKMKIFAAVMALFLFLESLMVVGTFNLGRKTSGGDGGLYFDAGAAELSEDMTASDALDGYSKSFK